MWRMHPKLRCAIQTGRPGSWAMKVFISEFISFSDNSHSAFGHFDCCNCNITHSPNKNKQSNLKDLHSSTYGHETMAMDCLLVKFNSSFGMYRVRQCFIEICAIVYYHFGYSLQVNSFLLKNMWQFFDIFSGLKHFKI